jgi:hypothetical protein
MAEQGARSGLEFTWTAAPTPLGAGESAGPGA